MADPFATKLSLMVHQYKLKCLVKRLGCCAESQTQNYNKYLKLH